jgi:hypothetical protein
MQCASYRHLGQFRLVAKTYYSEGVSEVEMYLSVADASRVLGVTPQAVRLMIRRGTLHVSARTVGGIQLFRGEDVERLAVERRARQAAIRPAAAWDSEVPA